MKKIILITFLLANLSIALGQRTSVKTQPTGSGPVLSGVSIVHTKIGVDPTKVRFEKRMPTYNVVNLKFSLNGNVSSYRYKGKTYQTYYPSSGNLNDCPGAILNNAKGPSMGLSVKATIVIRVNRQTYTQTTTTIATAGVYHFRFTLDEYVQEQFVDAKNIVSITVEPVPISYFENQLDRMEQCKERKENEKKAKEIAEKEAKGQKTTQKDDDFWAGGEETKLKIVMPDAQKTESTASKQPETKKQVSSKNEKNKETEEEEYYYAYIWIYNGYSKECGTKIGEEYWTNIFKIPKNITDQNLERVITKNQLIEMLKKASPSYSYSCIEAIVDREYERDINNILRYQEHRQTKEEFENYWDTRLNTTSMKFFIIEDFHPFGK